MERRHHSVRTTAVLLLAVVVVGSIGTGATGAVGAVDQRQQPTGDEIIDRVEQRYESADTIAGRAVLTTTNASETTTANVSFAVADPESSRLVVERGDETYRSGTNGSVTWTVGPAGAFVWDADSAPPSDQRLGPGDDDALAWTVPTDGNGLDNVSATLAGTTEVDGVPAYELELRPTSDDDTDAATTLWVAQEDYRVLRAETTDGTNTTTVDVTETFFDVSIDESTFQPPEDRLTAWSFDRYDDFGAAQNATDIDLPSLDGGTFSEATVTVQQGETVVSQRYDLDGENVTVVSTTSDRFRGEAANASTVQVAGQNASVTDFGDRSAVFWTEDDVTTVVIVDGSTERAVEIAERVST
ncbi:Outer membrane lipoprotein-sorting protein [Halomicrobium zhouii]|uniref:Outer membrane lipoprotein-sorting protein n=1 Tax=Halomicrobium zhouii TaxID=767519 RepID=A0A1I6LGP6_9EURY|nr:hypothetical protein [Halomicrobium zhouii]SFS02647.1 Outer membrane lipoprotein-sorting protein [Halomicrobium zhouii]